MIIVTSLCTNLAAKRNISSRGQPAHFFIFTETINNVDGTKEPVLLFFIGRKRHYERDLFKKIPHSCGGKLPKMSCNHAVRSCNHAVRSCNHAVRSCNHAVRSCNHAVRSCNHAVRSCNHAVRSCNHADRSCNHAVRSCNHAVRSCNHAVRSIAQLCKTDPLTVCRISSTTKKSVCVYVCVRACLRACV